MWPLNTLRKGEWPELPSRLHPDAAVRPALDGRNSAQQAAQRIVGEGRPSYGS